MYRNLAILTCFAGIILSVQSMKGMLPSCSDGSTATCKCGDGSDLDWSLFPPIPCKSLKPKPVCSCPPGANIELPKKRRACSAGRPSECSDGTKWYQLVCFEGGQETGKPTATPGGPIACQRGVPSCQNGDPKMCSDGSLIFSQK